MPYTEYITTDGDRLDTIAYKAYGDPFAWGEVLHANPGLPIQTTYPAGVRIVVPIIEPESTTESSAALLPPWKR
ncbi:MAG: tail protein X [Saprospiraceae bacterium]